LYWQKIFKYEVQKSTNYCTPTTKSLLTFSVQSKNFKIFSQSNIAYIVATTYVHDV